MTPSSLQQCKGTESRGIGLLLLYRVDTHQHPTYRTATARKEIRYVGEHTHVAPKLAKIQKQRDKL